MKKSIALIFALLCCIGCDKVPINGKLDGMWQLTSVQTPEGVHDARASRAYLSFQLHLSQWDFASQRCYAHFSHEADSLRFFDFAKLSAHSTAADDDPAVTPAEMAGGLFGVYGIHTLDARFRVVHLSHSSLILEAADTTLTFRKF